MRPQGGEGRGRGHLHQDASSGRRRSPWEPGRVRDALGMPTCCPASELPPSLLPSWIRALSSKVGYGGWGAQRITEFKENAG